MRKITIFFIFALLLGSAVNIAYAKIITCEVATVQGDTIELNCDKKAGTLKPGEKVTVKTELKKREAYHGC